MQRMKSGNDGNEEEGERRRRTGYFTDLSRRQNLKGTGARCVLESGQACSLGLLRAPWF